jgi:hypothetical protein
VKEKAELEKRAAKKKARKVAFVKFIFFSKMID